MVSKNCLGTGMGLSYYTLVTFTIAISTFFFATWETYHTHTLYLGYINGPTEGILITCTSLIISGYYGIELSFIG